MTERILYVSVDMEADGPVPGVNSMLSLGADARLEDGTKVGIFSENLLPLEGAVQDPKSMAWWAEHPRAWAATQINQLHPSDVMHHFADWLALISFRYKAKLVFVAYPCSFDYDYVLYYLRKYVGHDPFAGKLVDMRSMAMGILGVDFDKANKANMPPCWPAEEAMSHIAVEDATQQADLFFAMLRASRSRHE